MFKALGSWLSGRPSAIACDQFLQRGSPSAISKQFRAKLGMRGERSGAVIQPGNQCLIVREMNSRRELVEMYWGEPRTETDGGVDKQLLLASGVKNLVEAPWSDLADDVAKRCLIPVERFAYHSKKRDGSGDAAWYSVLGQTHFAWGGFWTQAEGDPPCFAGAVAPANAMIGKQHKHMPVILREADWDQWLRGGRAELEQLWRPFNGPLNMSVGTPSLICDEEDLAANPAPNPLSYEAPADLIQDIEEEILELSLKIKASNRSFSSVTSESLENDRDQAIEALRFLSANAAKAREL